MIKFLYKLSALFFKLHLFFMSWAKNKQKHSLPISEINKEKWYADKVEKTLRYKYELNEKSIVIDVGAYEGDFAAEIFARYQCQIFTFEPVKIYVDILNQRFKQNKNITIIPFGLGHKDAELKITVMDEASSYERKASLHKSGKEELIKIQDVQKFIENQKFNQIDLIKINIEGAEYDLLDKMIENNIHLICRNIQVQFHDFYSDFQNRYNRIITHLEKSHKITYSYPFVWENWALKQ